MSAFRTYALLDHESLWQAACEAHALLSQAGIPHAVVGGVAVCLHGYRRDTISVDYLIRADDLPRALIRFEDAGWARLAATKLAAPHADVVQFLLAGAPVGCDAIVGLPDPKVPENLIEIENLPVLTLSRLIETKLASGQGNLRRTHRDFADVVELIAARSLNSSFARHLHKSLRTTFRELVRHARGEEH